MYDLTDKKRSVRKLYTESLIGRGDITLEEAEQALQDYQGQLEKVFTEVREGVTAQPAAGPVSHPRLLPQLQRRASMVEDGTIDWGMGETLAVGSLLLEGTPVRLSGQDSQR